MFESIRWILDNIFGISGNGFVSVAVWKDKNSNTFNKRLRRKDYEMARRSKGFNG